MLGAVGTRLCLSNLPTPLLSGGGQWNFGQEAIKGATPRTNLLLSEFRAHERFDLKEMSLNQVLVKGK